MDLKKKDPAVRERPGLYVVGVVERRSGLADPADAPPANQQGGDDDGCPKQLDDERGTLRAGRLVALVPAGTRLYIVGVAHCRTSFRGFQPIVAVG